MRVQAAGDSGHEGTEHESFDLRAGGIHAHGFGRDLVLANGHERSTVLGPDQAPDGEDRDRDTGINPTKVRKRRNARHTARAAHRVHIEQHDANDLAEPESDDRQIVAFQAQSGQTHEIADEGREQSSREQRRDK